MFRWIDHTAELELEIEAPSEEAVFAEALAAFAELAGDADGPAASVEVEVEVDGDDHALLLVEWLSELIYLSEAERLVPERTTSLNLEGGKLRATVEGRRGRPRHLVKAVTLHRLELRRDDMVGWRARVVLDV